MSITKQLGSICKKIGVTFTLKSRIISYEEVFSETGLLPGLVRRADQLSSLCFGYNLGASFEDLEKSLLGVKVKFDDFTPDVLRLFCLTDVIHELIRGSGGPSAVSLDELMYD